MAEYSSYLVGHFWPCRPFLALSPSCFACRPDRRHSNKWAALRNFVAYSKTFSSLLILVMLHRVFQAIILIEILPQWSPSTKTFPTAMENGSLYRGGGDRTWHYLITRTWCQSQMVLQEGRSLNRGVFIERYHCTMETCFAVVTIITKAVHHQYFV